MVPEPKTIPAQPWQRQIQAPTIAAPKMPVAAAWQGSVPPQTTSETKPAPAAPVAPRQTTAAVVPEPKATTAYAMPPEARSAIDALRREDQANRSKPHTAAAAVTIESRPAPPRAVAADAVSVRTTPPSRHSGAAVRFEADAGAESADIHTAVAVSECNEAAKTADSRPPRAVQPQAEKQPLPPPAAASPRTTVAGEVPTEAPRESHAPENKSRVATRSAPTEASRGTTLAPRAMRWLANEALPPASGTAQSPPRSRTAGTPQPSQVRTAMAVVEPMPPGARFRSDVRPASATSEVKPSRFTNLPTENQGTRSYIGNILDPEVTIELKVHRSKLIRTKAPVTRFSITRPELIDLVQYSPSEFELIPLQAGQTTFTLWFGDEPLRYLVRVLAEPQEEQRAEEYGQLERKINELFPNSMVQLIPLSDKLIVRGQAKDSEEAAHILSVLSGLSTNQTGAQIGPGSFVNRNWSNNWGGLASNFPAGNIISLLEVPGEQQIMLKVRVAELSRTALRQMGANLNVTAGDFSLQSLLQTSGVFSAVLNTQDLSLALQAVSSNSYSKILAEPNLVTLNGQSASFIAGGEFAVPTVVGVSGAAAVSTQFRGFGTQVTFIPTIMDKDRIRLQVSPSFSSLNQNISVEGVPGLNQRAVVTTVDLREGQWLAIAGLLQDEQEGSNERVPGLGDIPWVGTLFSRRSVKRGETELVILVSPELVHPMDAQETPLVLPGMELTEPGDWAFFLGGSSEGRPHCDYRSTAWPTYQNRVEDAKHQAIREAKCQADYQNSEKYYVYGPHGLSR